MLAAFIPVSLAATNVAKLLALIFALACLALNARRGAGVGGAAQSWTVRVVLAMLLALALSLFYSTAPWHDAASDFGKYCSKLLLIPAVLLLVRTRREAQVALTAYLAAQAFVVLTSCLLYLQLPVFWAASGRNSVATAYTSYLDQSMMEAAFAGLCWHLRRSFPGQWGAWLAGLLALTAVVNVLLMLPGRSGQVAVIGVVSLAVFWHLPRRWRFVGLATPIVLVALAMALSPQFNTRFTKAFEEAKSYRAVDEKDTSAGMRLHFWSISLQAIAERPLTGFGVGSWNQQYLRLQNHDAVPGTTAVRNPHQEYLLWGVHLGVGGIALVLLLLGAMARDALRLAPEVQRATLSVTAVLAISAMFNSVLFDAVTGEFFCITTGLLLAYGLRSQEASRPITSSP